MTTSATSTRSKQQPSSSTRRHFERPTRTWPFAMESLTERNELDGGASDPVVTQQPAVMEQKTESVNAGEQAKNKDAQLQQPVGRPAGSGGQQQQFGVRNYLHKFYGLPDDETSAKFWSKFAAEHEEEYLALLAAGDPQSEIECWHTHRRCFAWSVSIGTLVIVASVTCLLVGFLLPRQPVMVDHMEENDLRAWITAHNNFIGMGDHSFGDSSVVSLNALDRQALEHNNRLDMLKVGGMMGTCMGVLLLVLTLLLPPGSKPTLDHQNDETQITQINQALKKCFKSFNGKNQQPLLTTGLVASTGDQKIPVFQHVTPVQPQKN